MIDYENMKYKLGQKVYFMHTSIGWMEGEVTSVNKHMEYMVSGIHPLTEDYMYPTREALVKAQIELWQSMLKEPCARPDDTHKEPEECAHEVAHKKHPFACKLCGSLESCKHGAVAIGYGVPDGFNIKGFPVKEPATNSEECVHEEDGSSYLTYPAALKCKKCGEFYR